ncbi:hypothetical protein SALBM311S_12680 [Streptomyces alboniger]
MSLSTCSAASERRLLAFCPGLVEGVLGLFARALDSWVALSPR